MTRRGRNIVPLFILVGFFALSIASVLTQHKLVRDIDHFEADSALSVAKRAAPAKNNGENAFNGSAPDVEIAPTTCSILGRKQTIRASPSFVIIGAQKSGTTALSNFLDEHPRLRRSRNNETHFFDWRYPSEEDEANWKKQRNLPGNLTPEDFTCALRLEYSKEFDGSEASSVRYFEKTPSYLVLRQTPDRMRRICPHPSLKVVVLLRNPVDRAFSHFRMGIRTRGRSFNELIDLELDTMRRLGLSRAPKRDGDYRKSMDLFEAPRLSEAESDKAHRLHYRSSFSNNYLQRSMYIVQLRHWHKYFHVNRSMIVLNYETFRSDPERVYRRLLEFLDVEYVAPKSGFDTLHNYFGPPTRPMSNETSEYLRHFFRPYNQQLVELLGEEWRGVWE